MKACWPLRPCPEGLSSAPSGDPDPWEASPSPLHDSRRSESSDRPKKSTGRLAAHAEDPLSFLPRPGQGSKVLGSSKGRADRHGIWRRHSGYSELYATCYSPLHCTSQSPRCLCVHGEQSQQTPTHGSLARAPIPPCTSFHLEIDRDETIISRNDNLKDASTGGLAAGADWALQAALGGLLSFQACGARGLGAMGLSARCAHNTCACTEYLPCCRGPPHGSVRWFAVQSTWHRCVVEHIHAHRRGPICYTATLYHLVRQCSDNLHRSPRTRKTNLHHLSGNFGSLTTCPAVSSPRTRTKRLCLCLCLYVRATSATLVCALQCTACPRTCGQTASA